MQPHNLSNISDSSFLFTSKMSRKPSNQVTSTPVSNAPKNNRLYCSLRTPSYSLSSMVPSSPSDTFRKTSPVNKPSSSKINISVYANTKSPGLTSRIVQYDKAQKASASTHDKKYGSPGLFPVVHLFKRNVPVIAPKPKKVTVRIAPPDDLSMYSHLDLSTTQFPDNSRSNTTFQEQSKPPEMATRSVLDALKEISRKRIHAAADFEGDSTETCKRNKQMEAPYYASSKKSKRTREYSPPVSTTTSPTLVNPKRCCYVDPLTASFTSSSLHMQRLAAKRKVQVPIENPLESPLKLINAETQTLEQTTAKPPQVSTTTSTSLLTSTEQSTTTQPPPQQATTPVTTTTPSKPTSQQLEQLQMFDDKPLEILRKNKLAALLGALTGEEPTLIEPIRSYDTLDTSTVKEPPKLTTMVSSVTSMPSILSVTSVVSPNRSEKHVTFTLPTVDVTQTTTAVLMPISSTTTSPSSLRLVQPPVVNSTASQAMFGGLNTTITAPSSSISLIPITPLPAVNATTTTAPPSFGFGTSTTSPKRVGGFKFDLETATSNSTSISAVSSAGVMFKSPTATALQTQSIPSLVNATTPASSKTAGGFGFNLEKSPDSVTFGAVSSSNSQLAVAGAKPIASITFGNSGPTPATSATTGFGTSNGAITQATPAFGGFNAGSNTFSAKPATTTNTVAPPSFGFGTNTTANTLPTVSKSIVAFGAASNGNSFGGTANSAPFGNNATTNNPPSFGSAGNNATPFGAPTSNATTFGAPSNNVTTFGATPSSNVTFGNTASNTTTFGAAANNTTSFGTPSNNTPTFGSTTNNPITFGSTANNQSTTFGGSANNATTFGTSTNNATTFGGTTNNTTTFGGTANNTTTFGSTANNPTPSFGAPSSSTALFGATTANNSTNSVFGGLPASTVTIATPTVASTTTAGFSLFAFGGRAPNNTTAPPASNAFAFGSTATVPTAFGASAPATVTTASSFSLPATAPPSFASATAQSAIFGGSFAAPTTTNSTFGSTNAANIFNTAAKPAATFGGGSTAVATFGGGNSTSFGGFSSGNNNASAPPPYGATSSVPTTVASGGFAAGSNATTTSQSIFSFGGAAAVNSSPKFGAVSNNNGSVFGGAQQVSAPVATFGATSNSFAAKPLGGGTNSGFGSSAASSAFSPPAFGGSTNNNTAFGSSGGFGNANTSNNATFNKPSGFGSSAPITNGFGNPASNSQPAPPGSGLFTFGGGGGAVASSNNEQKPVEKAVFSFGGPGSSVDVPKPSGGFNFSAAVGVTPGGGFGGGSPAAPSFGGGGVPTFNAPTASGMFTIGSTSGSTNRPRSQIKGKRRT